MDHHPSWEELVQGAFQSSENIIFSLSNDNLFVSREVLELPFRVLDAVYSINCI